MQLNPASDWELTTINGRVALRCTRAGGPGPVVLDFVGGPLGYARRRPGSRLLLRAVGRSASRVIDATGGLGRDAFALACAGHTVTALERSPAIFALLEDGLRRAMEDGSVREQLDGRLRFLHADARDYLLSLPPTETPDVVYLDPMFPPRGKTAQVGKESVALRAVVGDDTDAAQLLRAGRAVARHHVVVKRHTHAEPLAPDVHRVYEGVRTRFDVYLPSR